MKTHKRKYLFIEYNKTRRGAQKCSALASRPSSYSTEKTLYRIKITTKLILLILIATTKKKFYL